jgi:hypothetical protein
MSKSRNTTPDAFTVVQAGDTLGSLIFIGDDGTNLDTYGATISNVVKSGVGENDMPTELIFSTNSGTTTVAERMKIQHNSGNNVVIADGLTLTDGNLIIGGSGHGIDFGATGNVSGTSSEILGDYEEGTWTPLVTDGTNNAGMYASAGNGGKYTKIGRAVTFTAQVTVQTIGSVGANAYVSGLPFTNGAAGANRATAAVGYGSSLNITAGRALTAYVELNQQNIYLNQWSATTGTSGLAGSEITDGGTVFISGTYYVN